GFPSDTLSTHYIHQPGVAQLKKWGLLEKVQESNCPPARYLSLDVGPFALTGTPTPVDGVAYGYAPRRTVLDKILVDAAVQAGAELREHFTVKELVTDGDRVTGIRGHTAGGATVTEHASIVVGADGMRSMVARSVQAPTYNERPARTCVYYSYWSDLPVDGAELYTRPGRLIVFGPTNDAKTLVIIYWPHSDFHRVRSDIESSFMQAIDMVPGLAERVRNGRRSERFEGTADLPFFFRKPYGPGWALVGDAGYHKDPNTAEGISDAFRDADLLAEAIDAGLSGRRPLDEALGDYEQRRNEAVMPIYEMTHQLAGLEPPSPEMQQLFAALRYNQEQTDRFFGTLAGTVPIPEFFAPENIERIIAGAGKGAAA
ncbi:MAG TPA: NAD(P)/FAD-dependent oxidoreductase, partial [Chloroflexia bacterium]|nr:NAD(P)/FAD-dependent oxidoreductase [Chloroflexia bacterium]